MILLGVLVLIAGVLTFLTPCTLPILPAYLAFTAREEKTTTFARTVAFGSGVALVFLVYGILAGAVGSTLGAYKDAIARTVGAVLVLLGILTLAGKVPELHVQSSPSRSYTGIFLFGIAFALSWSACIGPILGLVLVLAASTQTALWGGILMLVYVTGLMMPLMLASLFFDRARTSGLWRLAKGRMVRIGTWEIHTATLISGAMLILIGLLFLARIDVLLGTSPFVSWVFGVEERIAQSLNISLG